MIERFADPAAFTLAAGLFGLVVGSFLNVVIHRLPKMMERDWHSQCAELRGEMAPEAEALTLATPRSRCPHCGHMITALENIPIVSWLILRGKCSACRAPISIRYPLVEAVTGLLSAFAAWHFGPSFAALGAILFIWAMVALTGIDFDTQLLPDSITLPLLWLGLLVNINGTFAPLSSAVIGAVAGYLSLWSVYWGFKLTTGKEGMGFGDFKLLAAIGAWLGWQMLLPVILFSAATGAVVGIAMILLRRHGRDVPMPFGPFLAAAGWLVMMYAPTLVAPWWALAR